MNFYALGDIHGELSYFDKNFFKDQKKLKKDSSFVFQLGDFGGLWFYPEVYNNYKKEMNLLRTLAARKFTLIVIPGNHENYDLIEGLPIEMHWGGKFNILSFGDDKIYFARRGEIYTILGKKVFTFGGAKSEDIEDRVSLQDVLDKKIVKYQGKRRVATMKMVSYWPRELPSKDEYSYALKNLERYDNIVDYVFTHNGPSSVLQEFFKEELSESILKKSQDEVSSFLDVLKNKITFEKWCFGHIHKTCQFDNFYSFYGKPPVKV